jgi:ABC-type transport system involved in multi-copper enzyme maturation permease subunit
VNFNRILTISQNVFSEVIRERILYLIGFYAIVLFAVAPFLKAISVGTEDKILIDFGLALMGVLGLIVTLFIGTTLINKEIERRTVLLLISKPMSRSEFIAGKHLGLSAVLAVLLVAMSLIYFGFLSFQDISYPLGSMVVAILYLLFELSLLCAVAILFGVFTNSLLATCLTFAVYIMGHLSRDLLKLGDISQSGAIQTVTQTIYLIIPDLARLDLKNQAVYGLLPSVGELILNAIYGVFYIILILGISNLIFWKKEF